MKRFWSILLFLTLAVLSYPLFFRKGDNRAGLHWQTLSQNFDLPAGLTTHSATFPFANNSGRPITIQTIKPDCSCLVSQLAQPTIPPGGTGEIKVIFNPGDRSGKLQRTLEVSTKEFPGEVVLLHLNYTIPELIQISHRLLFWEVKGQPLPQAIQLTMPNQKINVIGVHSTNNNFSCEIIPLREGRQYKVQVTPTNLSSAMQSVLLIDTDYPGPPWNRIVANVKIQ